MSKKENFNTIKTIPPYYNNTFSLLIPYYSSDKWTNKLKNKVKSLAEAYKAFYKRLEQENTANTDKDEETFTNNIKSMRHNKYFSQNIFNKTSPNYKYNNNSNNISNNNSNEYDINQKNILNRILPPVTNFRFFENESKENTLNSKDINETFFNPNTQKLFCISAQQRNQKANMNKYYSNQKMKDFFYFKNHKNIFSTKDLFSSKAHDDDYNKFILDCQNKNRISFFKRNDYNPRIKSTQPKDRRQITAMKSFKKKQYLDYIKAKSEDNYMRYYYYQ
jgi:hypothetical protein